MNEVHALVRACHRSRQVVRGGWGAGTGTDHYPIPRGTFDELVATVERQESADAAAHEKQQRLAQELS